MTQLLSYVDLTMDRLPPTVDLRIVEFTGHHERWDVRAIIRLGGQNHIIALTSIAHDAPVDPKLLGEL